MDEIKIPELICQYLNGMGGDIPFVPEAWREGAAAVWLTGGGERIREYVDGSSVVGVPFDIRVRCVGRSVGDRLDAVGFFRAVAEYMRRTPMTELTDNSLPDARIEVVSGASKSAVFENGEEEYRAAYRLRWFDKNN